MTSSWLRNQQQQQIYIYVYSQKTPLILPLLHWNPRVIIMPTSSSLVAPEVVIMTTYGATSDDKVGSMKTLFFCVWVIRIKIILTVAIHCAKISTLKRIITRMACSPQVFSVSWGPVSGRRQASCRQQPAVACGLSLIPKGCHGNAYDTRKHPWQRIRCRLLQDGNTNDTEHCIRVTSHDHYGMISNHLRPLLLTWINFNPSMDK